MQIEGRKWKLFGSTPPDSDGDDSSNGLRRAEPMLYESRADGSVLVGLACWAGPQYPNGERSIRDDGSLHTASTLSKSRVC
jgi:hypothetical protein